MQLRIKVIGLFFLILLLPCYTNAQYTVVMENYPPNSYFEDAEKKLPTGLEVDITREVLSQMGIKAEYKFYPWARCIEMMKNGEANAVITIFRTPEREQFLYYPSEHTILVENAFFKLRESKIKYDGNLSKLKNYGLAVKSSTSYGKEFDKTEFAHKYEVPYTEDVIRLVENKRVQLGIGPIRGINYFTKKMGNSGKFSFLKPLVCNDPLYIAFSKKKNDSKFAEEFSKRLKEFKKSNKFKEILSSYGI